MAAAWTASHPAVAVAIVHCSPEEPWLGQREMLMLAETALLPVHPSASSASFADSASFQRQVDFATGSLDRI